MNRQQRREDIRKLTAEFRKVQSQGTGSMSGDELKQMASRIQRLRAAGLLPPAKKKNVFKRALHFVADRIPW